MVEVKNKQFITKKEALELMKLVYKNGFENGIGFCNEILGKFGDDIEELKERGHLRKSFDWDKEVEKEIKRNIKKIK